MKKEVVLLIIVATVFLIGCSREGEGSITIKEESVEEEQLSKDFKKCESLLSQEIAINCKEEILEKNNVNLIERSECNFIQDPILNAKCTALFYQKTAIETNNRNFCNFIRTDNPNTPGVKEIAKIKEKCFKTSISISTAKKSLEEIKEQETKSFPEWIETFPIYYSKIDGEYLSIMNLALSNNDIEICESIETVDDIKTLDDIEALFATESCKYLLIKQKAYLEKDYDVCIEFINNNDNANYEECTAPITAYVAIVENKKSHCSNSLTIPRLIEECEEDYEKYI